MMGMRRGGAAGPARTSTLRALLALVPVLISIAGSAQAQPLDPILVEQIGIDQKLGGQVPLDLTFRNEAGETVALGEYFGERPVVLSLVYYECPMLCTQVLNGLLRTLRAVSFVVGREFDIVTVSIDPVETPALAASKRDEYAR